MHRPSGFEILDAAELAPRKRRWNRPADRVHGSRAATYIPIPRLFSGSLSPARGPGQTTLAWNITRKNMNRHANHCEIDVPGFVARRRVSWRWPYPANRMLADAGSEESRDGTALSIARFSMAQARRSRSWYTSGGATTMIKIK